MTQRNIALAVKIKALVEGLNEVASLGNELSDLAETGSRPIPDNTARLRDGIRDTHSVAKDLLRTLTGLLGAGAITQFARASVQEFSRAEAAFRGLESVANFSGAGIGRAMEEAGKLAADGLITTQEASKGLQNLLSRGYDLDQAVTTLTRLKDAAAFNRQAHLSLGEAVVTASEGLKNENSILVDNAGVTKNVSILWKEYAEEIGKTVGQLTLQDKIQAEVNGILRETEAQTGNAAKAAEGLQGRLARLDVGMKQAKATLGQALVPATIALTEAGAAAIERFLKPAIFYAKGLGVILGETARSFSAFFDLIRTRDLDAYRARREQLKKLTQDALAEAKGALAKLDFELAPDNGLRRTPPGGEALEGNQPPPGARRTLQRLRIEFDASFILLKDALTRERKALDASLDQRLISHREYWARVNNINAAAFDAERERLEQERVQTLAHLEKLKQARDGVDQNQLLDAQERINKLDTDLIILQRERLTVAGDAARKQAQAEKELAASLEQVRRQLRELTGQATDLDRRAGIAGHLNPLLERLQAIGDQQGQADVLRLIDVQADIAALDELERQFSTTMQRMQAEQDSINIQRQSGLLTEIQARQQIRQLMTETADELDVLIPRMEALGGAIGDQAAARVAGLKNEVARLRVVVDEFALRFQGATKNALSGFFSDIMTGSKNAFFTMVQHYRDAIAAILAERAATRIVDALLGAAGAVGSAGGTGGEFLAGLFKGFAEGGYTGDGAKLQPAGVVHAGEYVFSAASVRRLGLTALDNLHRLSKGAPVPRVSRLGYADGGLVTDLTLSPASAPTVNQSVRIVNSIDPRITKDFLASSEGEKVILNIISRNNAALKQVLT